MGEWMGGWVRVTGGKCGWVDGWVVGWLGGLGDWPGGLVWGGWGGVGGDTWWYVGEGGVGWRINFTH